MSSGVVLEWKREFVSKVSEVWPGVWPPTRRVRACWSWQSWILTAGGHLMTVSQRWRRRRWRRASAGGSRAPRNRGRRSHHPYSSCCGCSGCCTLVFCVVAASFSPQHLLRFTHRVSRFRCENPQSPAHGFFERGKTFLARQSNHLPSSISSRYILADAVLRVAISTTARMIICITIIFMN